jgi:DNA (cytosine-5)-methyltransferase 1
MDPMAVEVVRDVDYEFLTSTTRPASAGVGPQIGIVDLFSGCGGLTLGALEGARRAGRDAELILAVDSWPDALQVLADSLGAHEATLNFDLGRLLDLTDSGPLETLLSAVDKRPVRLLVAGPPCQGHSALNNHSRHDDERNDLYLVVARVALALRPDAIVIENVRGVSRDRRSAMRRCVSELAEHYHVAEQSLQLSDFGAPQSRIRHVVVATADGRFDFERIERRSARDVRWAIGDLAEMARREMFDAPSVPTATNRARMEWLVKHPDQFDLPNSMRPACHQSDHSYKSMYGQLRWDWPAQTITSGFGSMGQGRFVHPGAARTLTPHEAARLQSLPDYMDFSSVRHRTALATMIGNAAPPVLTVELVQALISQDLL